MQYKEKISYKIIGLMSGTSIDGVDLCCVNFDRIEDGWNFQVKCAETFPYPTGLFAKLKDAMYLSGLDLFLLDKEIGDYFGDKINLFITSHDLIKDEIDAIASHGHTVFHQPEKGLTVQIGCGETIAFKTGIKTINDFRKKDVLNGGQGAPLVPIGDKLLFSSFADSFLNIGGFANFSKLSKDGGITAYDICPANILINYLTRQLGLEFDRDGEIARQNSIDENLLKKLNGLDIYSSNDKKSLSFEFIEQEMVEIINSSNTSVESKISTLTNHAAFQIAKQLNENKCERAYITGGGAKNKYLVKQIKLLFNGEIIIPNEQIIDFKEALIFAFLGLLNLEGIPNCVPSVTGAKKAVIGGVVHEV